MKTLALILLTAISSITMAQSKKQHEVIAERVVQIPADQVWHILAEDYGAIANSHPSIVKSEYTAGTVAGCEGAERMCYFNEKGSQMFHEKIIKWEPEKMSFTQIIVDFEKFPIDKENTEVVYSVEKLDANTSKMKAHLKYRTKPAIMGAMAKGKFKGMLEDYFLAIEHHIKTGENVNVENFKAIKKQYETAEKNGTEVTSTNTLQKVKTGEITFKKDKLIEVALLTIQPGKEAQFEKDYFSKAFPIGAKYGARLIGSFAIQQKDQGNVPAQMLVFFEWNSVEDFRKFNTNLEFVKIVNIRNEALSFLTTGLFTVDKDVTYELSTNKTYEFAALWLANPTLLQEYFQAVLPLAKDPKIQFELIAQLTSNGQPDGTYHPNLIFFSEWKAGYKGKEELLQRAEYKNNVHKREKAAPYKDVLIITPIL